MVAWQNFFFLTGSAAAALSGLMFIAITFGAKLITKETLEKATTFYSPIWFHFVQVFVLSAVASMPLHSVALLAAFAMGSSLWRLASVPNDIRVIRNAARESKDKDIEASDWWLGVILPATAYTVLALDGIALFFVPEFATEILAVTILAVLTVAMRQAWEMLLWTATTV